MERAQHPADFCARSIFDVDFRALARAGVRGVLIDVDNTLVAPRADRVSEDLIEHLRRERLGSDIERWVLASNARRDLSPLATVLDVEVLKATWPVAKPRRAYYRRGLELLRMEPREVAMIGDKVLHDITPAALMGLRTVLVQPQWPDQAIDRVLLRRQRERRRRWVREARRAGSQPWRPSPGSP